LFETGSARAPNTVALRPDDGRRSPRQRVYVTSVSGEGTVLLDESRRPLSAPSWRPEGRVLAYARLLDDEGGSPRLQVLIREGLESRRTVATIPSAGDVSGFAAFLASTSPAWSPDGRYLAVPRPGPAGFVIIRADTGRVLKTVDDGIWPAWSPDGGRVAYVRVGKDDALQVLESGWGPSRLLTELGTCATPPRWTSDGSCVLAVTRREGQPRFGPSRSIVLVRVHIETGHPDVMAHLGFEMNGRGPSPARRPGQAPVGAPLGFEMNGGGLSPAGVSYALGPGGDDLFSLIDAPGEQVVWYRPRTGETFHKFHPVDHSVRAGGLVLGPGEKRLAMRFGHPAPDAPVGIWDVASAGFTPLIPDDQARAGWVTLLVTAARDLLRSYLPAPAVQVKTAGFDLQLMSSLNDVSAIPKNGKNLMIVAAVNDVLHFRVFDSDVKVVDTDETRLTDKARQIGDLRKQLESLWPPRELTKSSKDRVIAAVTSIVGHTQTVSRATIVPIPGEITFNQELSIRLRRIGRIGRPLCDRPVEAAPAEPSLEALLREARLFFDALQGDYQAALNSLDAVEPLAATADDRLRLLSLRAQLYAGLGEDDRAERVVEFLLEDESRQRSRIEETPAGVTLTPESGGSPGWSTYLAQRVRDRSRVRAGRPNQDDEPFGRRNPDNAAPAAGLIVPFTPRAVQRGFLPIRDPGLELVPDPPAPPTARPRAPLAEPPQIPRLRRRPPTR
jgi:hypothetical protein